MSRNSQLVVLKFGGSVLRSEADLPNAVHEIYRWWREGSQVIAVASAFADATDRLVSLAKSLCRQPEKSTLASLLATGEATSSALLGLALNRAGIPARVLDALQAGLRTVGGQLNADLVALDAARLVRESSRGVAVVPGFVGRGENGETTLLGRGGSDYSALFMAQRLGARRVLLKDVDGLYTDDPAKYAAGATRFARVSYETASRFGGGLVQHKAVRFAAAHKLPFTITCIGAAHATEVGPFADQLAGPPDIIEPLSVALLGCGTVGGGVYQRLAALPELFCVIGVGIEQPDRARATGVPDALVTTDLESLVQEPCDVVIELIGGTKRAASLTAQALGLGKSVVTANKALMAHAGEALQDLADENGANLHYSAAVGGAMPALEAVKRARAAGPLRRIVGVLNGTTNFVIEQLASGQTFSAAVTTAQERGYAEAQPKLDLNGIDAAQKLILLARAAFDVSLPIHRIAIRGIDGLNAEALRKVEARGQTVRLVAECSRSGHGLVASVKPMELPLLHRLAQARGAENCLVIEPEAGDALTVSGEGAGRWPTTEAVMSDLFEIQRNRMVEQRPEELEECVA